jgi:hypothetical protein
MRAGETEGRLDGGLNVEYTGDTAAEFPISTSSSSSYEAAYGRGVFCDSGLVVGGSTKFSLTDVMFVRLFSAFNFATQSSRYRT